MGNRLKPRHSIPPPSRHLRHSSVTETGESVGGGERDVGWGGGRLIGGVLLSVWGFRVGGITDGRYVGGVFGWGGG